MEKEWLSDIGPIEEKVEWLLGQLAETANALSARLDRLEDGFHELNAERREAGRREDELRGDQWRDHRTLISLLAVLEQQKQILPTTLSAILRHEPGENLPPEWRGRRFDQPVAADPRPFRPFRPFLFHRETENGGHEVSADGINWSAYHGVQGAPQLENLITRNARLERQREEPDGPGVREMREYLQAHPNPPPEAVALSGFVVIHEAEMPDTFREFQALLRSKMQKLGETLESLARDRYAGSLPRARAHDNKEGDADHG